MIQATIEETSQSLAHIRQEIERLANQLSADWFRLHDLLPVLETAQPQLDAARHLAQATNPLFRAFLVLEQAEVRATALQRQLREAQSWLLQAEAGLATWEDQYP